MTMTLAAAFDLRSVLASQPQLLVVLFAGAVWLFKMIGRARRAASNPALEPKEGMPPAPDGGGGASGQDLDEETRTRRVREDILRKIAERRGTASTAQPARFREERRAPVPPAIATTASSAVRGAAQGATGAAFPDAQPVAAMQSGGPQIAATAVPLAAGVPVPSAGVLWLEELRTRDSVRRAILVREVLGPPVALR